MLSTTLTRGNGLARFSLVQAVDRPHAIRRVWLAIEAEPMPLFGSLPSPGGREWELSGLWRRG